MFDTSNEKLSSLIDGELDRQQTLNMLEKIRQDPELAARYQRYQLVGELMRQRPSIRLSSDFATRVHDKLEQEAHYLIRPTTKPEPQQWRNVGLAVAASLFLAMIWSAPRNDKPMQTNLPLAQNLATERINPKLNEYLQAHDNAMFAAAQNEVRRPQVRLVRY
jgi:negative regulator of sigma E activity